MKNNKYTPLVFDYMQVKNKKKKSEELVFIKIHALLHKLYLLMKLELNPIG